MVSLDITPKRDRNGKPIITFDNPADREYMLSWLEANLEKPCRLVGKRRLKKITRKFYGYYWAVCCYWVAQVLTERFAHGMPGYNSAVDPEWLHEFWKLKFLWQMQRPITIEINGVECQAVIPATTTKLKTSNPENDLGVFTTDYYKESIQRFCAEQWDIFVPDPKKPEDIDKVDEILQEYEASKLQDDHSNHAL